ncbi:MAG TPA: succinate dehydrogenase, cytochrome b556 subunit [Burkholderiales bacterium]|nr:succinate dehydrogenase, cytochrome b556 subunit [Burkholderiales bacterium]
MTDPRPKYLDLTRIRLPVPAVVSILHRASGAALFLLLPFLLYLLHASLGSPDSYVRMRAAIEQPLVKLVLIGLLWAYLHHFCAGIRFLALDLHWGIALQPARRSARAVLAASLALTVVLGVWLW